MFFPSQKKWTTFFQRASQTEWSGGLTTPTLESFYIHWGEEDTPLIEGSKFGHTLVHLARVPEHTPFWEIFQAPPNISLTVVPLSQSIDS